MLCRVVSKSCSESSYYDKMAEVLNESELRAIGLRLIASCEKGDEEEVKSLLKHKEKNRFINQRDEEGERKGESALHKAARRGHVKIAQLLVNHGIDVDSIAENGVTPLCVATKNGHTAIVKMLLDSATRRPPQSITIDRIPSAWGMSPLMIASENGDTETARVLLTHKLRASVELGTHDSSTSVLTKIQHYGQPRFWTALMFACKNGQTQTVKLLLEHKAKVFVRTKTVLSETLSALVVASQNRHHETAEVLLEYGVDVDTEDETGTALMMASKNGDKKMIELLLKHGAKVNLQAKDNGWTALMFASDNGHIESATILVEKGADVNVESSTGTALMMASKNGHKKMIELLLNCGAKVNLQAEDDGWTALIFASDNGHIESATLLVEKGADVHVESKTGTALMMASKNGDKKLVELLLKHGAKVNLQAKDNGWTALMFASDKGHIESATLLVEKGADVNIESETGTALMMASKNGDKKMIELLLKCGAKVNLQAKDNGWTALMFASDKGHTESATLLVEKGADVNVESETGTALMMASKIGDKKLVELLLKHGAKLNLQAKDNGWTALMFACDKGHIVSATLLMEEGADVNIESETGTALRMASYNRYTKIVQLLLDRGASVNIQGVKLNGGLSALMIASRNGDIDTVKLLLKYGADVTLKDDHGKSALMFALERRFFWLAKLLEENESTQSLVPFEPPLTTSTSTADLDAIHRVNPANLTAETTLVVTNSEQHFTWHEYGLNIHIPQNSLPEGVQQCSIHIKASLLLEGLQLPEDTHLISAVYSFECSPECQFSKHLTLEIQHCAKVESNEKLYFVRAMSDSKAQIIKSGDQNIFCTHFPQHTFYGFVELDKFCKFGAVTKGQTERFYCAKIYHCEVDPRYHKFHFNIMKNTNPHNKIISDYYQKHSMKLEVFQSVEFEGSQIHLDIPYPSIEGIEAMSDKVWKIMALSPPVITKEEVDNFEEGKMIPSCQLQAECEETAILTDLKHIMRLKGAKDTTHNNAFVMLSVHVTRKRSLDDQGDNKIGRKCLRLEINEFAVITKLVEEVSPKWEEFGLSLGLKCGLLNTIKQDNPRDCRACFREIIIEWFRQQVDPPPSWSAIIKTLDEIGHSALAQSLKGKV